MSTGSTVSTVSDPANESCGQFAVAQSRWPQPLGPLAICSPAAYRRPQPQVPGYFAAIDRGAPPEPWRGAELYFAADAEPVPFAGAVVTAGTASRTD